MGKALDEFKEITKQSLPFLFIAGIGELFAGLLLSTLINSSEPRYMNLIPGMLLLLPALMNLRGAISSSFAARLGSAYHLGLLKGGVFNDVFKEGLKGSLVLALVSSVSVSIFAFIAATLSKIQNPSLPFFLFIAVSSSLLSAVVLGFVTSFLTTFSVKKNLDPDNFIIPVITTVGDIFLVSMAYLLMLFFVGVFA